MDITTVLSRVPSNNNLEFIVEFRSNSYVVIVDRYSSSCIKFHLKPQIMFEEYNAFCHGCLEKYSNFISEVEKAIRETDVDFKFKDNEFFYLYFQHCNALYIFSKYEPNIIKRYVVEA